MKPMPGNMPLPDIIDNCAEREAEPKPSQAETEAFVSAGDGDITEEQAKKRLMRKRTVQAEPADNTPAVKMVADLDEQVDKLLAEKQAQAERIAELEKYERFYQHIESHLTAHQVVICKICGKSLLEVEQVLKGETPAGPKEKRCEQR